MPGRNTADHVRMVNEKFYEAKDKGLAYDMIFVDFSKAFDSLDHMVTSLRHFCVNVKWDSMKRSST